MLQLLVLEFWVVGIYVFALGCLGRVCAFVMFADVVGVFVVWWVDWIGVLAGGFGDVVVCGV